MKKITRALRRMALPELSGKSYDLADATGCMKAAARALRAGYTPSVVAAHLERTASRISSKYSGRPDNPS